MFRGKIFYIFIAAFASHGQSFLEEIIDIFIAGSSFMMTVTQSVVSWEIFYIFIAAFASHGQSFLEEIIDIFIAGSSLLITVNQSLIS